MKYQKKPVTVEAFQWGVDEVPMWFATYNGVRSFGKNLRLKVSDGWITVYPNEYIIKGFHGEIYSCKPDIFEETYVKLTAYDEIANLGQQAIMLNQKLAVNDTDRISPDDIGNDIHEFLHGGYK